MMQLAAHMSSALARLVHYQHGDPAGREAKCGAEVDPHGDQLTRDWAQVTCPECQEWPL